MVSKEAYIAIISIVSQASFQHYMRFFVMLCHCCMLLLCPSLCLCVTLPMKLLCFLFLSIP